MSALNQLSLIGLKYILLQSISNSFQMNLILYLSVAITVLTIVVMVYIYKVLQIVLKAAGINEPTEEVLTIDWVKLLFVLNIGLGLISIYMHSILS